MLNKNCRRCSQPIVDRWYEIQTDGIKLAVKCRVGHKDIIPYEDNLDIPTRRSKHVVKLEAELNKLSLF